MIVKIKNIRLCESTINKIIKLYNDFVFFQNISLFYFSCIFHTRLYSIYTHFILNLYSFYSHSILNIYSKHTHVPLMCRLSAVHVPFTRYSGYTLSILNQTYSILFLFSNEISLHLGRPPPVFPVYKQKAPAVNGGFKKIILCLLA